MAIGKWIAVAALPAMLLLTSCRKTSSAAPESTRQPQPAAAHVEPERQLNPAEQSCKLFVQHFYDWYVGEGLASECRSLDKGMDDGTKSCERASKLSTAKPMSLKDALSPRLNRLLDEDAAQQAKSQDGIVGLEGDPFLNGNGGAIYDYVVGNIEINGRKCYAALNEVGINGNGEEQGKIYDRMIVELSSSKGKWMIDNIHYHRDDVYDPSKKANISYDDDLVHELNALGDK